MSIEPGRQFRPVAQGAWRKMNDEEYEHFKTITNEDKCAYCGEDFKVAPKLKFDEDAINAADKAHGDHLDEAHPDQVNYLEQDARENAAKEDHKRSMAGF